MFFHRSNKPILLPTIVLVSLGIILALAAPAYIELIAFLGQYIPLDDVISDYLVALVWAVALGITILFWPVSTKHKKILLFLWLARCAVALGFMLLFEYRYQTSMDALGYFRRALGEWGSWQDYGGLGTQRTTAVVWFHQQILPNTYHAAKITFSMFGLLAVYLFYRSAIIFLEQEDIRILYILGFFPSILLWSSILGKDPVVLLGIAIYTYGVMKLYQHSHPLFFILVLLGVFIASAIRPWMGLILCTPLGVFVIARMQGLAIKIAFVLFFTSVTVVSFNIFLETFQIQTSQDIIHTIDTIQQLSTRGGSSSGMNRELNSLGSTLVYLPIGIFTILFRPLPGELLHFFGLLSGVENAVLLFLCGLGIKRTSWQNITKPVVLWLLLLILIWAIFYALGASYNLGTAVRYKLQILPLFLIFIWYLIQKKPLSEQRNDIASSFIHKKGPGNNRATLTGEQLR
jgi:hypothetical protein